MSPFDTYSNGPAVVLPPQNQFNPSFFPESHHSAPISSPPNNAFRPGFPASFPRFSGPWPLTPATASNPSRKRSRDEFSAVDNDNGYAKSSNNNHSNSNNAGPPSPPTRQRQPPVEQPIYGEGMVLLNPRTGLAISADSQTGTWCEEKSEVETASAPAISASVGRKSQRLDATASSWDDITASAIDQKLGSSTHDDTHRGLNNNNNSAGPADPLIDDATRLLGISWQQISVEDKDIAAAIRGWEKYINNHYSRSIQRAQILLQHRGLNVYLVSAQSTAAAPAFNIEQGAKTQQQFYLFNEDLTEAQLIASDWNTCVQNLRTSPVVFENGSEVLRAADKTPERQVEDQGALAGSVNGNGNANETGMMESGGDTMMEID